MSGNRTESAALWLPRGVEGVEMLRASYRRQTFPRHTHDGYAFGVIEAGALGFTYRGERVVAAAGEINLVVPGEAHDGGSAGDDGWAYRMFYLEPDRLRAASAGLGRDCLPHFRPGVLRDPELAASLRRLHFDLEDDGLSLLERESRLLFLLRDIVARHADQAPADREQTPAPRGAAMVREYLEDNPAEDVDLERLAAMAGLSPFHFLRVFRREYGVPPHAYQTQVRVRRAKELLAAGGRPADVALALGFADQSHLTRQFKRLVGVTPGRYRNFLQDR